MWLASGADPKVVQRVLGHATAAMTMDLHGHMIDRNLWDAAQRLGGTTGHGLTRNRTMQMAPWRKVFLTRDNALEPPWGIEPQTYALQECVALPSELRRLV